MTIQNRLLYDGYKISAKKNMKFAVIEGLDGSGKSTQIRMLKEYMEEKQIPYKYLHFPRMDAPVYGDLIARFLRGELGKITDVDPWLVALIYAGDRNEAKEQIRQWMQDGYFVLVDRYVISNIAFQCAKLDSHERRNDLKKWILSLEYVHHSLPVPDINLFLDVPFHFTEKQLTGSREGEDRQYLNGAADIHEQNLEFQGKVREVYHSLVGESGFAILRCYDKKGEMLKPEKIFENIIKLLF